MMGNGRLARMLAVALVLATVGVFGQPHLLPGPFQEGVARAQSVAIGRSQSQDAPRITGLTQRTVSAITVNWLPANNVTVHWLYVVKGNGAGGRFLPAVPDPSPPHAITVTGLDAGTLYWFAILGVRAPSESNPSTWFRWSNWAKGRTLANQPPTITSSPTFSVAENTTAVGTVTVTDPDHDPVLGYSLSGTDAGLFQILPDSYRRGVLSFRSAPNFEAPQGGTNDDSNTYTLTVTATTGRPGVSLSLTATQNLTVTVTDVNEAPVFTPGTTISLAENTTAVGTVADPDVGDRITGHRLSGTDAALFQITNAGALTFRAAPDFEAPQGGPNDNSNTYTLTVAATGGAGDRALTVTQNLTVTVTDANDAPTFTSDATFSLAENTTAVGTVTAADPDADDRVTGYSLSGTDAALFQITSGGVLTFRSAPNFEAPAGGANDNSNTYTLTVAATGGAGNRVRTATQTLTVTVTDANEAPSFTSPATLNVPENRGWVAWVGANDADAQDGVTGFALVGGADQAKFGILTLGPGLGFLAFNLNAAADYENPQDADANNQYEVVVRATSGAGARVRTVDQTLTITVTNVNEAPTITSGASFSLAENTTAVGDVVVTDPDAGDSVTYTLGGTDAALFEISTAGTLSFSSAPDFEAPRGGTGNNSNSYVLTVTATDGGGDQALTASQALTVTVTDANDAPSFTTGTSFSAAENQTTAGTVTATDEDAADRITGYALSGTDAALFAITTAGVLTFRSAPNFEAPAGGANDDSNTYTLTVTATGGAGDRALTATQALTVTVTNVNEAPTITSDAAFSLAENTTAVGAVVVTDPDADDSVTYSLSGTDAALFAITSGGALSFRAAPNFEAPRGGPNDNSNTYTLTVTATDSGGDHALTATQDLTVTVTNANDAPTFTSDPTFSVAENATTVGTVTATDPDAADSVTGYILSGTDAALFAITSGGVLTFSSAPDFENPQGGSDNDSNTYTLTVTATGGAGDRALTTSQALTVTVTDANEAPAITSSATFSLAENTTAVGTVTAADPDATDSVTGYSLSGTDASLFQITTSGVLTFKSAPDFEAPKGGANDDSNSYALTVTATGGAGDRALTATQNLTVTVTDVNEAPAFTSDPTFSLVENTTSVGTVVAADPDADDSVTGYTLSGTDADLFEITTAGALSFSSAPKFESPKGGENDDSNTYTLTVTATGGAGDRALTATQDLSVTVRRPPWQVRTFQGFTGYWARLSWSAQKGDQSHGPDGGRIKLKLGDASVNKVRMFTMNKDESGRRGAGVAGGETIFSGHAGIGQGRAANFRAMPATVALFICGAGRFDTIGFAQGYDSNNASDPEDGANLTVEIWDGVSWHNVGTVVDGSENAQGLSFGIAHDVNVEGGVDGWITFSAP